MYVLRFIKMFRSNRRTNSVEPSRTEPTCYLWQILINIPYWMRCYTNGTSFAILPEISYQMGIRFAVFFRTEVSYLTIYHANTHEWRYDNYIGIHIQF